MRENLMNKHESLRKKLDRFTVDMPDFQTIPNRWDRFSRFLSLPTKDPLDAYISSHKGFIFVKGVPLGCVLCIHLLRVILSL